MTVVVPVHNVEEYLQECLDSLAGQTAFGECQVIIVDDGSTDGSRSMAGEFAEAHANVLLHVQENAGLGAARNTAMDLASTEFIMFCDSDDILPERAVETLLAAVTSEPGVPVAAGMMETFPDPTHWAWQGAFEFKQDLRVIDGIAEAPTLVHNASACNKIFDLSQIREWGLRFREGAHFEDVWLVLPFLLRAERIALVREVVYRYRRRPGGSIMNSLFTRPQNFWDHLAADLALVALREGLDTLKHEALDQFVVRSFQGFAMRACRQFEGAELRSLFEQAKALYRGVSVADLQAATVDTAHRVPVVACLTDDFELFAHPEQVTGVRARAGQLYLDHQVSNDLLPLLAVSGFAARVEQFVPSADGETIAISGRLDLNGLRLALPLAAKLTLEVVGSEISVPAENGLRGDLVDNHGDKAWTGFRAEVPTRALLDGRHTLSLTLHTDTGPVTRTCVTTVGYLRSARTLQLPTCRVLPGWGRGDQAVLEVRTGSRSRQRRSWALTLAGRDLVHSARRSPLWRARLARLASKPFMAGRDIWLVGERPDSFQDNSAYLFRHLRRTRPDVRAYAVVDRSSPDAAELKGLGRVVNHSSWRHKFLMLHASTLVNSYDIDAYSLPEGWDRDTYLKHLGWRTGARRVSLQHGVVHQDVARGIHRSKTGLDLLVTTTAAETEHMDQWLDYRGTARQLGLPRFDSHIPERGHRRLLVMTTWRNYLGTASYGRTRSSRSSSFEGSTLQSFLSGLFADRGLQAALERHGFVLEFLPHYETRRHVSELVPQDGPYRLVDLTDRTFQDVLRGCDLFVTDWSSTAFDVAYMGTPMVYAQFDAEEYWADHARPGYFDFARDGFGPVCATVEETVRALISYLDSGCVREELYDRRAAECFTLPGGDSCERVAQAIHDLEPPLDSPLGGHRR
ncbi:bifunctional glycosyltransferase/CDP-glycerol:glycerophosphate glycerophosphotransferase [Kitasatospora sp. McL0602]|uniref:bifunctional glycosyltransferase/CDP-glycerol:glycerophosphate glycerophosphotransferase n=1 Tax=Kitasatospora sp. McL0602 TaxID=3439530 RepID=UPI003F8B8E66